MVRYVIANRRRGASSEARRIAARGALSAMLDSLPARIVQDTDPPDMLRPRVVVVEASAPDMAARIAGAPDDVIVEPEILHWPVVMPTPDLFPYRRGLAAPLGAGPSTVTVSAWGDRQPLAGAVVQLYVRALGSVHQMSGVTGHDGTARFPLPAGSEEAAALIVPEHSFWTMMVRGGAIAAPIECPRLPADGPSAWWHWLLGLAGFEDGRGGGIKVGVVDSGAGPHPSVAHANLVGAFVDGAVLPPPAGADVGSHGTHVTGTIGGRPSAPGDYGGLAPGCDLYVARVYGGPESGASNADIANAIDSLSRDHAVDLVNLSLGATTPSEVIRDAIAAASERGTLCVCAAGNDGGDVNYPAAFPEAVAVAALGAAGWGPAGSLSASRLPTAAALFGRRNIYAANFTSHGSVVACAAPGVGILAPVPARGGVANPFAGMDGTSMACPVVCGALAVLLSRNAAYRDLPRDGSRSIAAKRILAGASRDLGLPQVYQGRGVPSVDGGIV